MSTVTDPVFASPPELIAPAGYSHVVTIPRGRLAWTAAQVAMTRDRKRSRFSLTRRGAAARQRSAAINASTTWSAFSALRRADR
jgi:hypothetical protein